MSFLNSGSMSSAHKALSSGGRPALATDNVMGQKVNRNKVFASSHGFPLAKPVLVRQCAYKCTSDSKIGVPTPSYTHWKQIRERLKDVLPLVSINRTKRDALLEEKRISDSKYGSVLLDSKGVEVNPFAAKLAALEDEMGVYRKMALTLLGTNKVKVPLINSLTVASAVTTGLVTAVVPITASILTDFSSFAAIFEEYRLVNGEMEGVCAVASATSISTPANTAVTLAAISYSTLSSAATTAAQLIDDEQSRLLPFPVIFGGADTMVPTKNWKFRWTTLPGVLDDTTQTTAGNWSLTSNTANVYGYLRFYAVVASAAAVPNAISGIMKIHSEFRMRI